MSGADRRAAGYTQLLTSFEAQPIAASTILCKAKWSMTPNTWETKLLLTAMSRYYSLNQHIASSHLGACPSNAPRATRNALA